MIDIDTATAARLAAGVKGMAWLIEADFLQGTLRYTTWPTTQTVTVDGQARTYIGAGNVISVGSVRETLDTAREELVVAVSAANPAILASALGSVHTYRGRQIRLYMQPFDEAGAIDGLARMRYVGEMDRVRVPIDMDDETGEYRARVELVCTRIGLGRARHNEGLRLSHAQLSQQHPDARGLEYLTGIIEKPVTWLTKAFQKQ